MQRCHTQAFTSLHYRVVYLSLRLERETCSCEMLGVELALRNYRSVHVGTSAHQLESHL